MKDYTERLLAARSVFKQLEADALGGLDYVNFIEDKNTLEFNDQTQKLSQIVELELIPF